MGSKRNYSAELQLIKTTLPLYLNAKSQTDVILLDFSKTFDKYLIDFSLKTAVLRHDQSNDWIFSFLSNRTQCVVCGGQSLEPVDVASGILRQCPGAATISTLFKIKYITSNLTSSLLPLHR